MSATAEHVPPDGFNQIHQPDPWLAFGEMQDYIAAMQNALQQRISLRIRTLRNERGMSQHVLSDRLGFNNRQTLADIENGKRAVTPDELAQAARELGVDVDYFTDAFRLVGDGSFSFRAREVDPESLDRFQFQAGRWIATYRTLSAQAGMPPVRIGLKLELTPRSSFEDAQACAEAVRNRWNLGDVPAATLEAAIQRELGVLVLYVDAPQGISGAAFHSAGFQTILVNRDEPRGRRNFDLAHELFHVLTWDAMPPARVEPQDVPLRKGNRVEQLAENFAAALLMPRDVLSSRWEKRGGADVHDWLNATATSFHVTAVALKWRLVSLALLRKADLDRIRDEWLVANGGVAFADPHPNLFSPDFVRLIHTAVESGRLSVRKSANLLAMNTAETGQLFRSYGLESSYDL